MPDLPQINGLNKFVVLTLEMYYRQSIDEYMASFFNFPKNFSLTQLKNQFVNSYIFLYGLQIFNQITDYLELVKNEITRFVETIQREYSITGHTWLFLKNEYVPISCWNLKDYPSDYDYIYNDSVKVLREKDNFYFSPFVNLQEQYHVPLDWVMGSVTTYDVDASGNQCQGQTWYLDSIYNLTLVGSVDENGAYYYPTPDTILACWSLHTGIWFPKETQLHLTVMTRRGEMLVFNNLFTVLNDEEEMARWQLALGIDNYLTVEEEEEGSENVVAGDDASVPAPAPAPVVEDDKKNA